MVDTTKQPEPPKKLNPAQQRDAERAQPWPPGVSMVRLNKKVTGLHVHPGGIALLPVPGEWQPQPAVTSVKRTLIRSKLRIKLADGSKLTVRPYAPGRRALSEVGTKDTIGTEAGGGSSDSFTMIIVLIILIFAALVSPFFLVRELFGLSSRAKYAGVVLEQIRGVIAPTGTTA